MEPDDRTMPEAWVAARFAPDELAALRGLIRTHEQRLEGMDPTAMTAAIVDAVYADVVANPNLAVALRRAARIEAVRRLKHARLN
jgi:hypothetical protein